MLMKAIMIWTRLIKSNKYLVVSFAQKIMRKRLITQYNGESKSQEGKKSKIIVVDALNLNCRRETSQVTLGFLETGCQRIRL